MEISTIYYAAQILGMVILGTLFIVMIKSDVKVLKVQMDGITDNLKILNASFTKLSDVLSQNAVMDSRISRAEADIRDLRHGRGFVQPDINGEYGSRGKISSAPK